MFFSLLSLVSTSARWKPLARRNLFAGTGNGATLARGARSAEEALVICRDNVVGNEGCDADGERGTRWEHFDHGADIGVRGVGPTREAAFEQIALALTGAVTDPAVVRRDTAVEITCEAPTDQLLVVEWLNALVYEMATRHMLFGVFTVILADSRLSGTAWGERIDVKRHAPAVEVKGATYTALRVAQDAGGAWVAECVVDV
jgi:SHS2 domain-containing protein